MKFQFKGTVVVISLDGAVIAQAGNIVPRPDNLVLSLDASGTIDIDTTKLFDGQHFVCFEDYQDYAALPTNESIIPFTVQNHRYMHFGRNGEILSQYDPAKSVIPISIFGTGEGLPSPADMKAMGISQISFGAFLNPNDNPAGWRRTNFANWCAAIGPYYQSWITKYAGFLIHHPLDDIFRNDAEKEFLANCSWATDAIKFIVNLMPSNVIMLDMMDEIYGDPAAAISGTWTDPTGVVYPYTLPAGTFDNLNLLMGTKNVSWPSYAGSPNTAAWDKMSKGYVDVYYTEKSLRNTYGRRSSLYDRVLWAKEAEVARIDPTKPMVALSDLCSETRNYPISSPGMEVLGLLMHHFLIMGAAGARLYSWDPAHPSWPQVRAAATIGNLWIQAHVANILQPLLPMTDMGPWFAASRRQNMLAYINLTDSTLPLECESFGVRSIISVNGIVSKAVTCRDFLMVGPNQIVVYIR